MRARWQGKLVLKGILCVEDAQRAVEVGADGIVLLEPRRPAARFLRHRRRTAVGQSAAEVGDQLTVLVDGGFRRGSDVLKAIALGAHGVMIGRATLYGLAAGGEAGVAHALGLLRVGDGARHDAARLPLARRTRAAPDQDMIAIREAWQAGLLGRTHWLRNLIAGFVVGVVALPLAMAFAIASGAKPEQGIYTAIIAGGFVSLFGGSRLQIAGPTGAFVVILAGVTARHGIDGLQIATFMAGAMLLALGLARMGGIIRYIPDPVITGFTAGIGVIIFVGQWRYFLGLPVTGGAHFHEKVWELLQAMPQVHWATAALAVFSLAAVVFSSRLPGLKRIPGPLVALVLATMLQAYFRFDGVATIGTEFGGIPRGLPYLAMPEITLPRVLELIGPAFAIAMLGAIESLLSAVVADGMAGTTPRPEPELIGAGHRQHRRAVLRRHRRDRRDRAHGDQHPRRRRARRWPACCTRFMLLGWCCCSWRRCSGTCRWPRSPRCCCSSPGT